MPPPGGETFPPDVLSEARRLAEELRTEERLTREQAFLLEVEAYLDKVIRGEKPDPPRRPDGEDGGEVAEEHLRMLARAFGDPSPRLTRLNLATRRAAVHYHNYELAHDNQVISFHVAALRARAAATPHADV